jgi:hypothetical protein
MAETLYSDSLVEVLSEKKEDLAAAGDVASVDKVLKDVQKVAAERTPRPLEFDRWVYRVTVAVLGLAVLFVAYAQFAIVMEPITGNVPRGNPDGLIAIGSAAIGALAGLLAPTPTR